MSEFSVQQEMVKLRVVGLGIDVDSIDVSKYDEAIKRALNWAGRKFCIAVKWQFLIKPITIKTASGRTAYDFYGDNTGEYDFGELKSLMIYNATTGHWVPLVKCQESDIEAWDDDTAVLKGLPEYYAISGLVGAGQGVVDTAGVHIGGPTADGAYDVKARYYRKIPDMVGDADESLVTKVYGDAPLIEGAVYRFALDMSFVGASQDKFDRSIVEAQTVLPFDGPAYPTSLMEKEVQE